MENPRVKSQISPQLASYSPYFACLKQ
uniref:Uncharacterized protein n=1 Tax=Anguilla anguilla TaxID=7936 RepID=A0A0E9UC29_ANGAN